MTKIMQVIIDNCKSKGISQRELAEKAGLTEASISRYFNDERIPNLKNAERMAQAMGLKLVLIKGAEE